MPECEFLNENVVVPGNDIWQGDSDHVTIDGGCFEAKLFVPNDAQTLRLYAVFWGEKEHGATDIVGDVKWIPGPAWSALFGLKIKEDWPKACLFMWNNGVYIPHLSDHDFDSYALEYDQSISAIPFRGTTLKWRVKPWNFWARQTNFRAMTHLVS